ncbi:hypothetical protein NEUTE1DRAFT_86506 [Neurospora tetrasperma FGSC 2508]|uniref:Uncharacterized protein n=1 Tax=Neurospora tetrasperma (strain FGSC 2508 / ATCC MYA-4615 / P0657) TaxID=510951 RepID=F8MS20_NEUT8|nr:uncharacterized protein NEUTE1DRAFT_86506 [Neurospora tetrasperma FGSC 2508]EGO55814.1 hypothetical protein NEUTE1DRAFT_86506 [Neurospora tetrasperma FGSC 2508]
MASHQKAKGISATLSPPSTKPADPGAGVVPENLYHTTLTVIDHHATTCGATTCLQVLGTHTTLKDARAFAYHDALRSLNYQPYDFAIYATRENFGMPPPPQKKGQPPEVWPYGDEVLVYAKARAGGQEFLIGVVEKPNTEHLASAAPGQFDELEEPEPEPMPTTTTTTAGARRHHHPPRRRRSSSITRLFQACEIEGCFPHKRDAVDFARRWLDTQKESGMFVQYDEREQLPRSFFLRALPTDQQRQQQQEEEEEEEEDTQQWPFGEDVLVHAVASTGENYCVAVRTVKGAKERFGKKVPRRGGREMDSMGMEMDMDMEVPRGLVREEGMEETMKGRKEKWRMSYYEDIPTKI